MNITEDSIRQLSPDESSTKAGLQLATTAKWLNAHMTENAMWGECQGSGKNPYFTQIDLANMAFKCSCPSRKFPCKHSLALLFLYAKQPSFFKQETTLHEKVEEWLGKRQERNEAQKAKADKPIDEAAQQKRALQREKKVEEGLNELALWMKDIMRTGIQSIPQNQYSVFKNITARMVDAQASGIAGMLKEMEEMDYYAENWEEPFLSRFSKLFFLAEAYKNKENLSEEWHRELKNRIGWNTTKDELEKLPSTEDNWVVLHVQKSELDKIISEKTWLWAKDSGRLCYQLQFYAPQQASQNISLIVGQTIRANTVDYPSVQGNRIWIKEFKVKNEDFSLKNSPADFDNLLNEVGQRKTLNPFQDDFSFVVSQIALIQKEKNWYLMDEQKTGIPLSQPQKQLHKIWALTRSKPFDAFVIYENGKLNIKTFSYEKLYYTF